MRYCPPFNLHSLPHVLRGVVLVLLGVLPCRAGEPQEYPTKIRPVLQKLCFSCHGEKQAESDLRIDALNADLVKGHDAETWHDILNRLNLGDMPPREATQPTKAERQLLVDWLTRSLQEAAAAKRYAKGRIVTRRLTRYEYQNTMRDLLGVNLDYAKELPPEPTSPDGFLNNGAQLEMSPLQLEAYLAAARKGLAEAIVTGEKPKVYQVHSTETARGKLPNRKVAGHEPVQPEFLADLKEFPRQGEFEIRIQAAAVIPEGAAYPRLRLSLGCVPGIVHVPRKLVGEVDVTAPPDQPQTFVFRGRIEDFPQPGDVPFGNVAFDGMIALIDFVDADGRELRYPDRTYAQPPQAKKKAKGKKEANNAQQAKPAEESKPLNPARMDIQIQSFAFQAPVIESWPPASHMRILFASEEAADETRYVRQVLERFLPRAFRRPVSAEEVESYAGLFQAIRSQSPSFEEAVRETLASVLVSPHFLYLVEKRDSGDQGQPVTDYELANRLSYFLWSTMPDERLFQRAREGKLREPKVLEAEVERLLADERSTEFVTRFADQWLDLDALDRVAVNPEFYPDFDETLKEDMRKETRTFVAEILQNDLSALNLLDSDWTMLNRRLAKHYGIEGLRSSQFERVALTSEQHRGGVLGQSAFLLSNSNGESSHPIKRAVWILDRLLDSPPAPPPPDVPELDAESPDLAGLTLKEQLALHRQKESCANCHRGIDPWGVPLENFDAIGRWRTEIQTKHAPAKGNKKTPAKPSTVPVDALSQLPNGTEISGFESLKTHLVEHRQELFARSVVKRLATYGLGRSLDQGDQAAVQSLTKNFIAGDFRLKRLIVDFVQSEMFQTK